MAPLADPVDQVRRELGRRVRLFLTGQEAAPRHNAPRTDPGLFGPDSVAWRVHADTAMLVGGLRSLLIQTLHPLAMAGVAEHSAYRSDPLGRLQRTAGYIGVTTYGTTAEAEAAIAQVRRVHARVKGVSPDGRAYDARDPHLLGWVHATEVDSFLGAYQRYAPQPLDDADADTYVAEMGALGERLGVIDAPRTRAELHDTIEAYRPELCVGAQAREAIRFLLNPRVPLAARPAYGVVSAAAVTSLPQWSRDLIGIPVPPGAGSFVVRPAATVLLRVLGWALRAPVVDEAESA